MTRRLRVLTVGGVDPTGRAGVAVDLRTFDRADVEGLAAITVVTAQSAASFGSTVTVPADHVARQIELVLDDGPIDAVKTGMLGSAATVVAVAGALGEAPFVVVDPVLVDRHGAAMFDASVVEAYRHHLIPRSTVLTPNADELDLLGVGRPTAADSLAAAAAALEREAGVAVAATGGRVNRGSAEVVDVVSTAGGTSRIIRPRLPTADQRGTGDAFSAAIAVGLAENRSLHEAVAGASLAIETHLAGAEGPPVV